MKLNELLKTWRCFGMMSTREAAEKIGIPETTLRRIEKGQEPSPEIFVAILRWLLHE